VAAHLAALTEAHFSFDRISVPGVGNRSSTCKTLCVRAISWLPPSLKTRYRRERLHRHDCSRQAVWSKETRNQVVEVHPASTSICRERRRSRWRISSWSSLDRLSECHCLRVCRLAYNRLYEPGVASTRGQQCMRYANGMMHLRSHHASKSARHRLFNSSATSGLLKWAPTCTPFHLSVLIALEQTNSVFCLIVTFNDALTVAVQPPGNACRRLIQNCMHHTTIGYDWRNRWDKNIAETEHRPFPTSCHSCKSIFRHARSKPHRRPRIETGAGCPYICRSSVL
jgi:hypothetical protein